MLTSRSQTELRTPSPYVQEFEPASQRLRPSRDRRGHSPTKPPKASSQPKQNQFTPLSPCADSARMPTPHVSTSMIEDWRKLPGNMLQSLEYSPHLIAPTGREETFANFSKTVRVFPAAETEAMQVLPCTGSKLCSISASSAQQCT